MQKFPGIYRGVIADVSDPEKRFRYRVRATGVHLEETSVTALRWAEVGGYFAAAGACDMPHFEVGDKVFVMFEGGDPSFPVIMGGWLASRRGVSDVNTDLTQDYERTRRKWMRVDRVGNMIEMSEAGDEKWIKVKSGKGEIVITQKDDSITLRTTGEVTIVGGQVSVSADQTFLDSGEIHLNAHGRDIAGLPNAHFNIFTNYELNLHVKDAAQGGSISGRINIGQYRDTGNLLNGGIPLPRQTAKVNVFAAEVNIGQYDDPTLIPTQTVNIAAAADVSIDSATRVTVMAPLVDVTAIVKASVVAPLVEITALSSTVSGALSVGGTLTVAGALTVAGIVTGPGGVNLQTHTHAYTDDGIPLITGPANP